MIRLPRLNDLSEIESNLIGRQFSGAGAVPGACIAKLPIKRQRRLEPIAEDSAVDVIRRQRFKLSPHIRKIINGQIAVFGTVVHGIDMVEEIEIAVSVIKQITMQFECANIVVGRWPPVIDHVRVNDIRPNFVTILIKHAQAIPRFEYASPVGKDIGLGEH